MSQLFTAGGLGCRKYWASASGSVLLLNIQGWFPLGLTGLIFLLYKGLSRVFFSTIVQKHQFFGLRLLYGSGLSECVFINEHMSE